MILLLVQYKTYGRAKVRLENANYEVAYYVDSLEGLQDVLQTNREQYDIVVYDEKLHYMEDALPLLKRLKMHTLAFGYDYQILFDDLEALAVPKKKIVIKEPTPAITVSSIASPADEPLEENEMSNWMDQLSALDSATEIVTSPTLPLTTESHEKVETNPFAMATDNPFLRKKTPTEAIPTPPITPKVVEKVVERIVEVEKVVRVAVEKERIVEVEVQTGIAQRVILIHSLFPRVGVSLLTSLMAQILASSRVRVAVIEAPGVSGMIPLMDLQVPSTYKDYRERRGVEAIQKDHIDYYPYRQGVELDKETQTEALLRLIYRLREYPLVLIDAGTHFFDDEVWEVADQVWTVLEPDPVQLLRVHQQGTEENNRLLALEEFPTKRRKIIMNKSSKMIKRDKDVYPGAFHIPMFPYDSLQESLWKLEWPIKNKEIGNDIYHALQGLVATWLPEPKEKRSFFVTEALSNFRNLRH